MSTFHPWQRRQLLARIRSLVFLDRIVLQWGTNNVAVLDHVAFRTRAQDCALLCREFSPKPRDIRKPVILS